MYSVDQYRAKFEKIYPGFQSSYLLSLISRMCTSEYTIHDFFSEPFFQKYSRVYHEWVQLPRQVREVILDKSEKERHFRVVCVIRLFRRTETEAGLQQIPAELSVFAITRSDPACAVLLIKPSKQKSFLERTRGNERTSSVRINCSRKKNFSVPANLTASACCSPMFVNKKLI